MTRPTHTDPVVMMILTAAFLIALATPARADLTAAIDARQLTLYRIMLDHGLGLHFKYTQTVADRIFIIVSTMM